MMQFNNRAIYSGHTTKTKVISLANKNRNNTQNEPIRNCNACEQDTIGFGFKPRLHERFFACDGDAIFFKLSRRQRAVKIACVATL